MKKVRSMSMLAALAISTSGAIADVVLTVNVSNPANVIVQATGGVAGSSVNIRYGDGIDLKGFCTTPRAGGIVGALSGTFALSGETPLVNWNAPGSDFRGMSADDLKLYITGSSSTTSITAGTVPFEGVSTLDLTSISTYLPAVGTTGELHGLSGGNYDSGLIGQWEIIPEPSVIALSAVFGGGMLFIRRRLIM